MRQSFYCESPFLIDKINLRASVNPLLFLMQSDKIFSEIMVKNTSWETSGNWYKKTVGQEGHYYHQHVVLPGALKLLNLKRGDSLLDIACGQGVLERALPQGVAYCGVDLSQSLIREAKRQSKQKEHLFVVADAAKPFSLEKHDFSHVAVVLALQNMVSPADVFHNAANHLTSKGKLLLILNHPCFRIPRQSSWGIEEKQKLQYRRIDRYASCMEIPVATHPGKGTQSEQTTSFHWPLSILSNHLREAGFYIELMDEWYSPKTSTGAAAKMENRARQEIPLFMALLCCKK